MTAPALSTAPAGAAPSDGFAAGFPIRLGGRLLKIATVDGEDFVELDPAGCSEDILADLHAQGRADVFAFAPRLPNLSRQFPYPHHPDNIAALPILGYAEWWEKRLNQDTRRCVRISAKRGLIVRGAPFDDELVRGICEIYNETPVRQGRPFWHFGKGFDAVKRENGTFLDRAEFIGAYLDQTLVGFLKLVYVGGAASIMQILARTSHYDRKPMNALMAKAVEICNKRKVSHLLYRKYVYHGGIPDSMTEFKRRNGFEQIDVSRYYAPLTAKGRLAVALHLHLGLTEVLPRRLVAAGLAVRNRYYARKGSPSGPASTSPT